jgi:tetratricopeptide (TPR) repeat protein
LRDVRTKQLGPDHTDTLYALGDLASAYKSVGRLAEAIALGKQARDGMIKRAGPDQPETLYIEVNLAEAYLKAGRLTEAIDLLEWVRDNSLAKLGPDDPYRFVPLFHLGNAYQNAGRPVDAEKCWREAIRLRPDFAAVAYNNLAWVLATCEDAAVRDPGRAVELARRAVKLDPNAGDSQNTLGVALYRTGDWTAAIETLNKSIELRKGGDSHDYFFLAMAHWQLGAGDEARVWFAKGVRWMDANAPGDDELRRFRAEAAKVLGVLAPSPRAKSPP